MATHPTDPNLVYAGFRVQPAQAPFGVASTDDAAYIGWSDSRSGRVDLPAEDAYVASIVNAVDDGEERTVQPLSVGLGAGIGLLVDGLVALVALVATRLVRRSRAPG